jgi:hypothetical protein
MINRTEIEQKYPKAYNAFHDWVIDHYESRFHFGERHTVARAPFQDLPFEMQTGVLEKFFDENDLLTSTHRGMDSWLAAVRNLASFNALWSTNGFKSRQHAQSGAFERCFEILEGKL